MRYVVGMAKSYLDNETIMIDNSKLQEDVVMFYKLVKTSGERIGSVQ